MKTPSTFLFDLLKRLTKSQKRYIKVQAGASGKDYTDLMEAIIKQEEYDEIQLIKDNQDANFIKHLSVNKQYLFDLLLKSLSNFGEKKVEDKIYQKISASQILIEKGLFVAAMSELKKAKKLAIRYEVFEMQIMIYNIEKQLLSNRQLKNYKHLSIHQMYNIETEILKQLTNTKEYWYLSQQISQFQLKFQKIQNEEQSQHIETIIQSPQLQSISLATNFKSKIYYFQANATYQFLLGNIEKAYSINTQFLDLLESNSDFLKLYTERYLSTFNNMLIDSLIIGKYDILQEGINRLILIPNRKEFKNIKNIESRVFRQRYLLLLNWSLRQNEFEKVLDWIPDIKNGLDKFGNKIEKQHRITFYYLIAYLLFQNKKFEDALHWNNLIINTPNENVVKEIFNFSRILNLLIHYELDNHSLLEYLLSSTPKFLKSRRTIYKTEKLLFRFLNKLLKTIDKSEKRVLITNFKDDLDRLYQDPKERMVFNYLDLRLWLGRL